MFDFVLNSVAGLEQKATWLFTCTCPKLTCGVSLRSFEEVRHEKIVGVALQ